MSTYPYNIHSMDAALFDASIGVLWSIKYLKRLINNNEDPLEVLEIKKTLVADLALFNIYYRDVIKNRSWYNANSRMTATEWGDYALELNLSAKSIIKRYENNYDSNLMSILYE